MVKWTEKMINELVYTKEPKLIAKKYKIGYETARRKLLEIKQVKSLLELREKKTSLKTYNKNIKQTKDETTKTIETEEKKDLNINEKQEINKIKNETEKETENKIEMFENINKIIVDVNELKKVGINFYIVNSRKKIGNYDKQFSDYRHILEASYDQLNEEELVEISKNIGKVSRKRRLFKNELDFIDNHRIETQGFLDFLELINKTIQKNNDKIYSTRILKEDIGHVLITTENNSLLKTLEDENKELKNKINEIENNEIKTITVIPDDIKNRLYSLEKFNLKEKRKKQRENGEPVAIDNLKSNWRDLFNQELDDVTKNGIIQDCYSKYSGVNIKEIRDLEVWGTIIPEYLVEKKYFIKEKNNNIH